jgi:hypothetical protein
MCLVFPFWLDAERFCRPAFNQTKTPEISGDLARDLR